MITSHSNPLIKRIIKLRKKRERDTGGVFLIEGVKEIEMALKHKIEIIQFLLGGERGQNIYDTNIVKQYNTGNIPCTTVTDKLFSKISYRNQASSIVAIAKQPLLLLSKLKLSNNPFILIVHGIEKPGNLGAILRTADAAGVEAVIVCEPELDIYNPNVVRASIGALFTVPTIKTSSEELKTFLEKHKIPMICTSPKASNVHYQKDLKGPLALTLGSEKSGLPPDWLDNETESIRIPMLGQMDSLNLSVSSAIIIYEIVRQRACI